MSGSQSTLDVTSTAAASDYTPRQLTEQYGADTARSLMARYGIDPTHIGVNADNLSDDKQAALHRYQYDKVYIYPRRAGPNNTVYEPIEFRTSIVTVGPPSEELKSFINDVANPRLRTVFNTGPYAGYMNGFQFVESVPPNIEDDSIAVDEAANIGVPQFEVLLTKGTVQGQSTGFFYPFEQQMRTDIPQEETWSLNRQGDRYQIAPEGWTGARDRAKETAGKAVYVNGAYIGDMAERGRVFLKKEYANDDQIYRGQHSREWLVTNTDATYAAIRDGGNLYKIRETGGEIRLVTAARKPADFDPTPATDVNPDATDASLSIEFADATVFDIRTDTGAMMGRYDTPTRREITELTAFTIY